MIKPAFTSRDLCVMIGFSECIGLAVLESPGGSTETGEDLFRECD